MKRTSLKRKTPFSRSSVPLRRTKLRIVGHSTTKQIKDEIQAILREIVIKRDGGCILRHYPETGQCGGYKKDGKLILQAEHLHTRSNSASFADYRLVVCLCKRHHIFWKPQHSDEYYQIVKKHIGKERTNLLKAIQSDYKAHKMDWKLERLALDQYLKKLST